MIKEINASLGLINQYFNSGMWSKEKKLGTDVSASEAMDNGFTYVVFKGYNILDLDHIPTEYEEDLDRKNLIIKHTKTFFRIIKRVFEYKWQPKSDMLMNNIDFFMEN